MNPLPPSSSSSPLPHPASLDQMMAQVNVLLGEGKVTEALDCLVVYLERFPRDEAAMQRLGNLLSTEPHLFRQHPSIRTLSFVAQIARTCALAPGQDKHAVMNFFYVASYLDPALGLGHYHVGKELLECGNFDEAAFFLSGVCHEDRLHEDCTLLHGIALVRRRDYAAAIHVLNQTIEPGTILRAHAGVGHSQSTIIQARFYLGMALVHLHQDIPKAINHFIYVVGNQHDNWRAHAYLGQLLPALITPTADRAGVYRIIDDALSHSVESLRLRRLQDKTAWEAPQISPVHEFTRIIFHLVHEIYSDDPVVQSQILLFALVRLKEQTASNPAIKDMIQAGTDLDIVRLREYALTKFSEWAQKEESAGRYENAIGFLEPMLFLDPRNIPRCIDLCRVCLCAKDLPRAWTYLNSTTLTEAPSRPAEVYYCRCLYHILRGEWSDAVAAGRRMDRSIDWPGFPSEILRYLTLLMSENFSENEALLVLFGCEQILRASDCNAVALSATCMLLAKFFARGGDRDKSEYFERLAALPEVPDSLKQDAIDKLS